MAPRPAVRCCSTVRSHLANAANAASAANASPATTVYSDGVWITDSVLAIAFARYVHVHVSPARIPSPPRLLASTRRRFSGHVPGPLEARRRLGKRQMTEQLSMQLSLSGGASPLPVWALPQRGPDLRQWQWTPPRDAALFTRNNSDSATPTAAATTTATTTAKLGVPKWLVELADLVDPSGAAVELPETARSATAAPFFSKVEAWTRGDEQLLRDFDGICSEFQTLLRLAGLTVDEVHEAFDLLWGSLESCRLAQSSAQSSEGHALARSQAGQASTLLSAVIDGVGACHLLQATDYGLDFWRSLFACVAQLPAGHEQTSFVASKVLLATPSTFLADMTDILPSHLCTLFVSSESSESSEGGAAQRHRWYTREREKSIADALEHIDLDRDGGSDFVQATTEQLLRHYDYHHGHLRAGASFAAASTSWLCTLAHMPKVRQAPFFQALLQLQKPRENTPVRSDDLCELLLAQWTSRGYVTQETAHWFHILLDKVTAAAAAERSDSTDDSTLAVLALALYQSEHSRPHCVALYLSLWQCLRLLGRDAELVPSVAALVRSRDRHAALASSGHGLELPSPSSSPSPAHPKPTTLPPVAFFESLAWASDDLNTALQMHKLYVRHISTEHSLGQQLSISPLWPSRANRETDTFWSVGFWDKYADRLSAALDQNELTPGQVSYAFDLPARLATSKKSRQCGTVWPVRSKKGMFGMYASKKKGLGAPTVALIEKLAVHFALAPNLSPRCALRGVEECRHLLVTHGRERAERAERAEQAKQAKQAKQAEQSSTALVVSPTVLRAIFHLVTRDLDNANHGRTTRLRWFVDIVRREYSEQEAVASGHALERWRTDAARQRKRNAEDERRAIARALQRAEQTT